MSVADWVVLCSVAVLIVAGLVLAAKFAPLPKDITQAQKDAINKRFDDLKKLEVTGASKVSTLTPKQVTDELNKG